MTLHPPRAPLGLPAPRPKPRLYKYLSDEDPDLGTIVFDIIDGLSIEEVEPELYQRLLPLLKDRERALKEWRNQPASKSIADAIQYIENYRYCNDPKRLQPRSLRTTRTIGGKLTETELSINVDMALRGEFKQLAPRNYRAIIRELQRVKADALRDGDYLMAERCVNASRKVLAMTSENRFEEMTTARVDELAEKLRTKENDRDEVKEHWARSIRDAERKRDADLKMMEKENEKELREFDKQFDLEPPPEMRKFSPQLLQLRVREKYMVQSGRYVEATEVRAEAEKMMAKEIQQHHERWIESLKLKRADLIKKQQERMYVRKVNANNLIEKMRRESIAQIDHQEKAVQHIESHYEDAVIVQNFSAVGGVTTRTVKNTTGRSPLPKLTPANPQAAAFRQQAMINTIVYSRTPKTARY